MLKPALVSTKALRQIAAHVDAQKKIPAVRAKVRACQPRNEKTKCVSLNEWVIDRLGDVIRAGGELVSSEQYESRINICQGCPYKGQVKPLPLVSAEGCTICGCPLRTKAKTRTHFSKEKLKIIETTCPHPEGNKWAIN